MKKLLFFPLIALLISCGGGPSLCDCVNEKADEKDKSTCENMEKEWKEKYKNASEDEKKSMREEIDACGKGKVSEEKEERRDPEESGISVCDCVKQMNEMGKEISESGGNVAKIKEIEEKYKTMMESCNKLGENKTDEEKRALAEEAKNCM